MDRFLYRIHCTTAIAAIKASSPNSRLLLSRCLFCLAVLFIWVGVFPLEVRDDRSLRGLFGDLPCASSEIRSGISYHPGQCNHNGYGLSKDSMTKGIYNINLLVNLVACLPSSASSSHTPVFSVKGLLDLDKDFWLLTKFRKDNEYNMLSRFIHLLACRCEQSIILLGEGIFHGSLGVLAHRV